MNGSLRRSPEQLAKEVGEEARRLYGLVRRVVIDRTRKGIWKILGYEDVAGAFVAESFTADLFGGVGFHSRPASGAKVEAIVLGQPGARVIVATRDESLRAAMADLGENETAIFTTQAIVHIKADGTIEIRSAAGVAQPVALAPDLEALKTAIDAWTPVAGDGGAALKTALSSLFMTWPNPATVLKAE